MAWLTPPIFQAGDADADIAATALGGGRASRLYKKLVYEQQIAQDVSVGQYSLMLGSVFQLTAGRSRPKSTGHATRTKPGSSRASKTWGDSAVSPIA
jgi:predicted Zn-dependent peptidase